MTDQRKVPPYSEAEVTRWLAWLAAHMRRRDLTIFQIESLQPDWLTGRLETVPHLLLTRTLWGMLAGLPMYGLIFVAIALADEPLGRLLVWLSIALVGPLAGLVFALLELATPIHKLDTFLRTYGSSTQSLAAGTTIFGLIFGLLVGLLFGSFFRQSGGQSFGLIFGLIFGFVRTYRVTLREAGRLIRTVESVQWSWQHVRQSANKGWLNGLLVGLVVGLLYGLTFGLSGELSGGSRELLRDLRIPGPIVRLLVGLLSGWGFGLFFGLIFGLIGGLIGGFQPRSQELKTHPNQGIWLTVWSSVKIGLSAGIIVGGPLWLLTQNVIVGLACGTMIFLIIGGWYGGLDAIEHYLVRGIIAWRGHAPLNYARFLDYADEDLNFLQKVGGGYIFIHRYLLEHFAELAVAQDYVPLNADGPPT